MSTLGSTSFGAVNNRFLTMLVPNSFTVESEKKTIISNFCSAIRNVQNDFDFLCGRLTAQTGTRNVLTLNAECGANVSARQQQTK